MVGRSPTQPNAISSTSSSQSLGMLFPWNILLAAAMFAATFAPPLAGQVKIQINGRNVNGGVTNNNIVLPAPPREIRRILSAAEKSIKSEEYSDAVEALTEILDAPDSEDFFLPAPDIRGIRTSLKTRALDLLGEMPAAGREMYELEVGAEARRRLKDAIESGDIAGVREVSRRFFHTKTGYQATMLLARSELDEGRPLAAVLHLQRLMRSATAVNAFDHELPFLLAACWQIAGEDKAAQKVIKSNLDSLAGAKVMLGGVEQSLPETDTEIGSWLSDVIGNQASFQAASGENWTLARGNATRNAYVDGGMPLAKLEWEMEPGPALPPGDAKLIRDIRRAKQEETNPVLPSLQPLAVGDQLLFRTARRMYGGSISEGRLIWEGPEDEPFPDYDVSTETARQSAMHKRREYLQNRMCFDATYGQMSSDGRRLFMITGNKAAAVTSSSLRSRQLTSRSATNQLIALELSSEGKMLWTSADVWDTPVFFLGAPLPIEDDLFAIAEIKDEVKLICMEPVHGTIRWTQQLAQVEAPFAAMMDATRRLAGATPSFADGIMVCPTSSGVVVAVDIASRTLLWAHSYDVQNNSRNPNLFGSRSSYRTNKPGDQWADSTVIIDRGLAILTPVQSSNLQCVDLLTGKLQWTQSRKTKDMLFAGGIHDGTLVMVGKKTIYGLTADTGKKAWDTVKLDDGMYTSGRGFIADGHYYLPVANGDSPASGAIVQIRMADGKVESQPTERVLGNLICHGDYMVSQGLDGIYGFALRDRKRDSVLAAVNKGTKDPVILEDYANILASDGERDKAIETMRRAYELQEDALDKEDLQVGLLRMINESLKVDFEKHQGLIEEATGLAVTKEEQIRLDNVVAMGLINIGKYDQALAAHLRLTDSLNASKSDDTETAPRPKPVDGNSAWRVSDPVSLANRIQEILARSADPEAAIKTIRDAMTEVHDSENASAERRDSWLSVFGNLPELETDCDDLRIKLAGQLLAETPNNIRRACNLLSKVAASDDDERAKAATLDLLQAYKGHPELAHATLQRAAERWADDPIDGETAADRLKQLKNDSLAPEPWRTGKVTVTRVTKTPARSSTFGSLFEVNLLSQTEQWPDGGKIFINSRPAQIVVVDGTGETIRTCTMSNFNAIAGRYASARHFGHNLIVSLGDRIVAIDMLADTEDPAWVYRLSSSEFGRGLSISLRPINVPFVATRQIATDNTGAPRGRLGAIGEYGICIIKGTELQCLDLETGQPRWTVRNAGGKVNIFGDRSRCYVSRDANGDTRVFEMRTGKELDKVKIPSSDRQWATFGHHLLHYQGMHTSGKDLAVLLHDCKNEKNVWKQSVERFTRGYVINNEELALMEPTGKLTIRRIIDGKLLLDTKIKEEKDLLGIYVWKTDDQYVMVTNRNDVSRTSNQRRKHIQVLAPNSGSMITPMVTGHMYAFDRKTKELAWDPFHIEQFGVPIIQPPKSPLFVALRQVTLGRSRSVNNCELAVVDKRNGKITLYKDTDRIRSASPQIIADQEKQAITVRLPPTQDFRVAFFDPDIESKENSDKTKEVKQLDAVNSDSKDVEAAIKKDQAAAAKAQKDLEARRAKLAEDRKAAQRKLEEKKAEAKKRAEDLNRKIEEKQKQLQEK